MKFRNWLENQYDEPTADTPSDDGYVYHGTSHYNLYDIIDAGHLGTFRPWHGTEQSTWPDGSTERRSYWTSLAAATRSFIPLDGKPVLLRTKAHPKRFRNESGTSDIYCRKKIPIEEIEVLQNGIWKPLGPGAGG